MIAPRGYSDRGGRRAAGRRAAEEGRSEDCIVARPDGGHGRGDQTMILGLKRGDVRLVPHQPGWSAAFAAERQRLATVVGAAALQIEHVGSTAVPDLPAKPVIDVAVAVRSLDAVADWSAILAKEGYSYFGDREGWGEYFFAKGPDDNRTIYLHVVPIATERWRNYLKFRDVLRVSPSLRNEYAELKQQGAVKFVRDRAAYTKAKESWIRRVLESEP